MSIDRRTIIGAAVAIPLVSSTAQVNAAPPAAPVRLDLSTIRTADQFAAQVIGRADLSRAVSEIAVGKIARADAREFSGYELAEARTVVAVLKDLGTPMPAMGPEAQATFTLIANAREGAEFDRTYMAAQFENHAFLRDLAAAYLKNSDPNTADADERHGRHLATVSHWAFTEHVGITSRILRAITV